MASPTPTELAREAIEHSNGVRHDFELLKQLVELHDLPGTRELMVRLEARVIAFEKFEAEVRRIGVIDDRVAKLETRAAEADQLREQVAVLKDQMGEMKKSKDKSNDRLWNVLMIAVGAILSLLGGVVVQLVAFAIKK